MTQQQPFAEGVRENIVTILIAVVVFVALAVWWTGRDDGPPQPVSNSPGYENPAPGNDGSYDCPPGGGPVWVGSNDPAGLDGDGDGWGCE